MSEISDNIKSIISVLPAEVKLLAVSKTHSVEEITDAYNAGQRIFGENKVQELVYKYEKLKSLDIKWHLIGHLQTNKVKFIAPFVDMIHSVDSLKLLNEIDKQSAKYERITDCLLQFHIATEETKFGFSPIEAENMLKSLDFSTLKNVRICGVMGMASFTENKDIVRVEFQELRRIYNKIKHDYFADAEYFSEISMGMSGDWELAVEEGSTIIRVGSIIFGKRNYNN